MSLGLFLRYTRFFGESSRQRRGTRFARDKHTRSDTGLVTRSLFTIRNSARNTPTRRQILFFQRIRMQRLFITTSIRNTRSGHLQTTNFDGNFVHNGLLFFDQRHITIRRRRFDAVRAGTFHAIALYTFGITRNASIHTRFGLVSIRHSHQRVFRFHRFHFLNDGLLLGNTRFFGFFINQISMGRIICNVRGRVIIIFRLQNSATNPSGH